jgi:hypothetical protein
MGTAENVPPTARVLTVNVAVVCPAGTMTFPGTVTGSLLESVTVVPAPGAGDESITVPVTGLPPTTLEALNVNPKGNGGPATVMVAVACVPLIDAVIVDVPAATPVIGNVAEEAPAATFTDAGIVTTPGGALDSATVPPAFVDSATMPCVELPGAMFAAFSVTLLTDSAGGGGGGGGGLVVLLQRAMISAATTTVAKLARRGAVCFSFMARSMDSSAQNQR